MCCSTRVGIITRLLYASWYRKQISLASSEPGQRYLLYFESANMTADVYVNGQRAGGHVGGYLGFEVDVTGHLKLGQDNEILVRLDNGINRQIIPSQKADFVLYGGLTRDVWLRIRPQSYISSVQIDTPRVSAESATALVSVALESHSSPFQPLGLVLEISGEGALPAATFSGRWAMKFTGSRILKGEVTRPS